MNTREYCCYTRPYSEIEGLQLAHTLLYSASAQPEGIVLELRVQQGGGQGNGQRGEQCEQHFENFHGLKPPWKSLARSGGRSASEC